MKRLIHTCAMGAVLFALGGCVYGPGYYQRPGVVYDDGTAVYSDAGAVGYGYDYAPGYYPYYGCCYAGPWLGLGFYGNYYYGGPYHAGHGGSWHDHERHDRHGGWHGGRHGPGNWRGSSHMNAGNRSPRSSSSHHGGGGHIHRQ